jgi:hypothetical protein
LRKLPTSRPSSPHATTSTVVVASQSSKRAPSTVALRSSRRS